MDELTYRQFQEDDTNDARAFNRDILRQDVVGVQCIYAGKRDDYTGFSLAQQKALKRISDSLAGDETVGTVEVYINGAMNVYCKRKDCGPAFGAFLFRPTKGAQNA